MIPVTLPDGRKINVNTNDPAVAEKTRRVILAREDLVSRYPRMAQKQGAFSAGAQSFANSNLMDMPDVLNADWSAVTTGARNLATRAQGGTPQFGMADTYAAQRLQDAAMRKGHPAANAAGQIAGALTMPGAKQIAGFVKSGAPELTARLPGFLSGLQGPLAATGRAGRTLRGALVGVPLGGFLGAEGAPPGHEGAGAAGGSFLGGITGGLAPSVTDAIGGLGNVVASTVKGAGRVLNKTLPTQFLDPMETALGRVSEALRKDGATPQLITDIKNAWLNTGAPPPSLLDVASKLPSGGSNTIKLMTGAGMKGGAGVATNEATRLATAFPGQAQKAARALTPQEPRPANVVAGELEKTQSDLADQQFKGPYQTPITMTPEAQTALGGNPGVNAVKQAATAAEARMQPDRVARLQALIKPPPPPQPPTAAAAAPSGQPVAGVARVGDRQMNLPQSILDQINARFPDVGSGELPQPVLDQIAASMPKTAEDVGLTAGDLDRVRIAMGKQGASFADANKSDVGGGYFERAKLLDTALDQVPEIAPARATYRGMQGQRNALDLGRTGVASSTPDDFAAELAQHTGMNTSNVDTPFPVSEADIRGSAGVGYRQAATDAIGDVAAGGIRPVNALANEPNQQQIQDAIYGQTAGGNFRDNLRNQLLSIRNIRLIDPTTNSRSASRLDAMGALGDAGDLPSMPKGGWGSMLLGAVGKMRDGLTLTDDELKAIVQTGIAHTDHPDLMANLEQHAGPVQAAINELTSRLSSAATPAAVEGQEPYQ